MTLIIVVANLKGGSTKTTSAAFVLHALQEAGVGGPLSPPGGRWVGGPLNYSGYQEFPVWDPGFNQWGFWFFGVWIPL